jgi:hypothetical protein
MLTIPQQLPIKRMALYGSVAMLVGFVSTLGVLRQFVPRDSPSGLAVVETINKKPTKTTANGIEKKQADGQAASTVVLPDQGNIVIGSGSLAAQQYPRVSTATPTSIAPAATSSAPIAVESAPVAESTATPPTTLTPSQPPASLTETVTTQPSLQGTIADTNIIDINNVRLP